MSYPMLVLKNQFGELSNNFIVGGSSQLSAQFKVAAADASGAGISGLVGSGVSKVFMKSSAVFTGTTHTNTVVDSIADTSILAVGMLVQAADIPDNTTIASITSATAITLSQAATGGNTESITYAAAGSPNPQSGIIVVQFGAKYLSVAKASYGITPPVSNSNINISSGLTVGNLYQITSVGSSSASNWHAVGLPAGVAPAVGAVFCASVAAAGTGSGIVRQIATAASAINQIDLLGDASKTLNPASGSAYVMMACYGESITMNSYTPAGVITNGTPDSFAGTPAVLTGSAADALVAPADGAIINLALSLVPVAGPLI